LDDSDDARRVIPAHVIRSPPITKEHSTRDQSCTETLDDQKKPDDPEILNAGSCIWKTDLNPFASSTTSTWKMERSTFLPPANSGASATASATNDATTATRSHGTNATTSTSTTTATSTSTSTTTGAAAAKDGPTSQALRFLENDPARTGYDPSVKWWMNYFKILTGQMTPEGMHHYREDRYRVHEERDCRQCEQHRDWLFANSPTVRFLQQKVEALNGRLDASNVVCRRCPARVDEFGNVHRQSGGFSPAHGILLCANEITDRSHLEDTLAHEMVHAWDHLRWKVDWFGEKSLRHAACTEVSGSNGPCSVTNADLFPSLPDPGIHA
jgi:mitochondrial inner membrane protease ATP23